MQFKKNLVSVFFITLLIAPLNNCGKKRVDEGDGPHVGPVESAFNDAANTNNVPVRFMFAAAYVESRMASEQSSTPYRATNDTSDQVLKGIRLSQTAFGLTTEQLGIKDDPKAETFGVQVAAYAKLLAAHVADLKLNAHPATAADKFQWVWEISTLHRASEPGHPRNNLQVIFAYELMQALNNGFIWQDMNTGELIRLQKELPVLKKEDFPADRQSLFSLDNMTGSVPRAQFVILPSQIVNRPVTNRPTHIEVIHCPLTLSACLELQTQSEADQVRLGAHYVIPQDGSIAEYTDRALQVANHDSVVTLTGTDGRFQTVQDALIVAIVGNSGRYVQGKRHPAIPTWMTPYQLKLLGGLINDLCQKLASDTTSGVNYANCVHTSGTQGVNFRSQVGEDYRWGDIPDYDETIFKAYIDNGGNLPDATAFEFNSELRQYNAGEPIPIDIHFGPRAKLIEVEFLVRCRDQRVVWAPEIPLEVRAQTHKTFNPVKYAAGPNGNGDYFLRARVTGANGEVIGWAVDRFVLNNFETGDGVVSSKYCQRNSN